jgi:hypothetical protein
VGGVKEGQMEENQQALVTTPAAVVEHRNGSAAAALTAVPKPAGLLSPFSNESSFIAAQRMAKALSSSSLVPKAYQGNVANCMIAMELASRIGVSVLATMQNLDVIQGKPSWSAKFLIATVNASGRYTPLRFEWDGKPGTDAWACRAKAKSKEDGELCVGPWVTWLMAKKEGWVNKSGSKWQTLPELMFTYRAAAFWCRTNCPEISIGFQTTEEIIDTYGEPVGGSGGLLPEHLTPAGAESLEAVLGLAADAEQASAEEPAEQPTALVVSDAQKALDQVKEESKAKHRDKAAAKAAEAVVGTSDDRQASLIDK